MNRSKKLLSIAFILLVLPGVKANNRVITNHSKLSIHLQNLTPPRFPGGQNEFGVYLGKNLKWPKDDDGDRQGIVIISFFVEKDGRLTDIQVKQSLAPAFDAEALRVIKASPNWVPALRDGKPIKSKYTAPIKFFIHE